MSSQIRPKSQRSHTHRSRLRRLLGPLLHLGLATAVTTAAGGMLYLGHTPEPVTIGTAQGAAAALAITELTVPTGSRGKSSSGDIDSDRITTLLQLTMLESGLQTLEDVEHYTATFTKQERTGEVMSEPQVIEVKIRHQPLGIYMHWLTGEKGREVLYVEGEHDGDMLVHPGGWQARLVPSVKIDPNGSLAMKEARYPVTTMGLVNFARKIAEHRRQELDDGIPVTCELIEGQRFAGKDCHCFLTSYLDRKRSPIFRKSLVMIDRETLLPVMVRNFGWTDETGLSPEKLDELTVVETYSYTDLNLDPKLQTAEFTREYGDYNFRR